MHCTIEPIEKTFDLGTHLLDIGTLSVVLRIRLTREEEKVLFKEVGQMV